MALFEIIQPFHGVAAILVFGASALITRIMIGVNIADVPNSRSSHTRETPTAGGLAVVISFCVGLAAISYLVPSLAADLGGLSIFIAVTAVIAGFSLIDDYRGLAPLLKLALQIFSAVTFSLLVAHFERLWLPGYGMVEFGEFGVALTILWIVGFMNAFNFLDGINGLASGGTLITAFFLAIIALSVGAEVVFLCCVLLLPATLGFYIYNFPSGRIFLGDVGSQSMGFIFAGMAVIGASADTARISFYVVPILFFGFIFDFTVTVLGRLYHGRNLFEAHREHLFQICHRLGLSHVRVCMIYYVFFALNGALAMAAQWADPFKRLYMALVLFPFYVVYAVVTYRAARRRGMIENSPGS